MTTPIIYTKETTEKLVKDYQEGKTPEYIAIELNVPVRSVIAKLSNLGVYKKKEYKTKQGQLPVRKSEYIERIADLLGVNVEVLESMEKVNKAVLVLIEDHLVKEAEHIEMLYVKLG